MKPTAIDRLNDQDTYNYTQVRRTFPHETRLVDDILDAYDFGENVLQPYLNTHADQIASALLVGICRNHLILGAVALFRIHAAQMFRETRSAVETAGIAYSVRRDASMLAIYLEDDGRPEQRKAAKKAFQKAKIFPATEPIMVLLSDEYDLASSRAHSNIHNFVCHLAKTKKPNTAELSIQDIPKTEIPKLLPLYIFWLTHAHIAILNSILAAFPDLPVTKELKAFKKELEYVLLKVQRFKKKLDQN